MFASFWALYPRKVSRKMAEKAWLKLSTDEQLQAIEALPVHIKYWESLNTEKEYIPHPRTWLSQARFEDEIEMPVPKADKPTVAWWSTEATVIAKGNEVGLSPRPGEDIHTFKGRVIERIKQAA